MTEFAALSRMLENLIRFGVITAVQMAPPRVQVKTGSLTTAWLPWLALRAGSDREWDPPTIDEQVILFSPSGQLANGVVVTGLFSDHIPANGNRAGLHRRTYADGAVIEYDSVAHRLNAILNDAIHPGTADAADYLAQGFELWPCGYIVERSRPVVRAALLDHRQALRSAGLKLPRLKRPRICIYNDQLNCEGCGRFLSERQRFDDCPNCGAGNAP